MVDFSKMGLEPEEANGTLTPYVYEDSATGTDFEEDPEEVEDILLGPFSREGLYLDTRKDILRLREFVFTHPKHRNQY